ncbi:hypothetical protein N9783_03845, partial [Planktomarina temperata]|nr:hypothetical protein [Planktomarina temperata]
MRRLYFRLKRQCCTTYAPAPCFAPRAYAQDNRHGETMGAAVAKTKLAGVYQHGHSGLQDPAKALAGFHRAASQGDVEAQYNLAKMYEDQDSVLFDYSKAHSWYRLAA